MRDAFLFEGIDARVRSLSGSAKDRRKHMDGVFLPGARCTVPAQDRPADITKYLQRAARCVQQQAAGCACQRQQENTGSAHTRHPGVRAKTHAAPDAAHRPASAASTPQPCRIHPVRFSCSMFHASLYFARF